LISEPAANAESGIVSGSTWNPVVTQTIGLFPSPVARVERLLDQALIGKVLEDITAASASTNAKSDQLSHTEIMNPQALPSLRKASKFALPHVTEFGQLLFGEALEWSIKEIWVNFLQPGGSQSVHTHANSFVSGVMYLTPSHPSANLVFHKGLGGTDFTFRNQNKNVRYGPYNGSKFAMPAINAGDLVLFPSYMLHEVPVNMGERRVSVAFNAIPARLDSFGYSVRFS
jgi:uncharacterized protein (TIGR02466 family)